MPLFCTKMSELSEIDAFLMEIWHFWQSTTRKVPLSPLKCTTFKDIYENLKRTIDLASPKEKKSVDVHWSNWISAGS